MPGGADDMVVVEIGFEDAERLADGEELLLRYREDRHVLLRAREFEDWPDEVDRPVHGVD